jgi:hypothetical protein
LSSCAACRDGVIASGGSDKIDALIDAYKLIGCTEPIANVAPLRATASRTQSDLWQAIADAIKRFTPNECQNYLVAAGCGAT